MKNEYNWWTDSKNADVVKNISWWNHDENKETYPLPISVIQEGEYFIVSSNDDTLKIIGDIGQQTGQGKTKEEAINQYFSLLRMSYEYQENCRLSYQRFIPFRLGPWNMIGGKWFSIFGFHFYFRTGKNMKGGYYIPFTNLNISFSNDWIVYENYKKQRNEKQ